MYKAKVLGMNDSRIHRNMKIARDDNTVEKKLGCKLLFSLSIIEKKLESSPGKVGHSTIWQMA